MEVGFLIIIIISGLAILFAGKLPMRYRAQNNVRLIGTATLTTLLVQLLQTSFDLRWLAALGITVAVLLLLFFLSKWLRLY